MKIAKRIQDYGSINYVNGGDETIPAGGIVVEGELVGCAVRPIEPGATGALDVDGNWRFPKTSGETFSVGAACYWDAANEAVTSTTSGTQLGVCVEAAASDDESILVALNYRVRG
ncbi:MAG: DUF2190 family protein [Thermoguttaceae bacterium]|nr:DUF2190 family protein [Thermoguttaceae bacterium]